MNYGSSFRIVGVFLLILFLVDENCGKNCGEFNETEVFPLPILKERDPQSWPWMVAIARKDRGGKLNHLCTGVLITSRHVLSSAHCFRRKYPSLYVARIGNVDYPKASDYSISRINVPKTYKRGHYYDDVAVLTLSTDVKSKNAIPICLPKSLDDVNLIGKGATVAGWKRLSIGYDENSEVLAEFSPVPVLTNTDCEALYNSQIPSFKRVFPRGVKDAFYCVDLDNNNACNAGSGSPLMYKHLKEDRWYVVGLDTFGVDFCGATNLPDGYTRVSNYFDWIHQIIQN